MNAGWQAKLAGVLVSGLVLTGTAAFGQHNALSEQEAADGWALLFNGDDLAGWTTAGDMAAWTVEDGEIRVTQAGRGWWLRTDRMYRDFELKADFVIPNGGNSGIGLRGSSVGDPAFTGFEVQIYDSFGREPDRSSCGAVYNAIAPDAQAVKPAGEWNSYHIRVVGDQLDVTLNGEVILSGAKLDERGIYRNDDQPLPLNERLPTGYIAFQDHGEGGLRLRNIKIKDLSADQDPGEFQPAFTQLNAAHGEIEGWTARGGGSFTIEDGVLIAADGPGHLFSDATHTDIELRAFVRIARPEETGALRTGNSGIYFRTVPRPEDPNTWPLGYEAQLDHHDTRATNYTGCIYDKAGAVGGKAVSRDGAWFDYRILATGDRVRTWVNGVPMVDATLSDFDSGHVAFQTHHPGNRVEFKDVQWRVPQPE